MRLLNVPRTTALRALVRINQTQRRLDMAHAVDAWSHRVGYVEKSVFELARASWDIRYMNEKRRLAVMLLRQLSSSRVAQAL